MYTSLYLIHIDTQQVKSQRLRCIHPIFGLVVVKCHMIDLCPNSRCLDQVTESDLLAIEQCYAMVLLAHFFVSHVGLVV